MTDELRFDGRVAIVTGAGRAQGLGEAHAKFLARRGCQVVVNDLTVDGQVPAQRVVDEIIAEGGSAVASGDTVTTASGGEGIVATALDTFGRIDIIVNNAGISTMVSFPEKNDIVDFTVNYEVHLAGAFNLCRAAWPHLVSNGYGRIVNTTSSAFFGVPADLGFFDPTRAGNSGLSYPVMKAGLIGFTKSLALLNSDIIKVNAVAPAATTQMGPHNATVLPNGDRIPLAPDLVSAGVAVLAHESCPVNAEIFGIGGGKIDRLFLGATQGYVDLDFTPESVLANWDKVMDLDGYWLPESSKIHADGLRSARALLLTEG